MLANIELIFLSFWTSLGFGIVFQIRKEDLLFAGLGGVFTRIVYIVLQLFIPYRIVYAALAAFAAAAYAEWMAKEKKMPATVMLYPAIVPLIPGDLFYYTMAGVVLGDELMFTENAIDCILALVGISVGFVICSTASIYIRRHRARNS